MMGPAGEIIPVPDTEEGLIQWGEWMARAERHVGNDMVKGLWVSTVFLGLDHGWGDTPLWFETMVFGPRHLKEVFGRSHMLSSDLFCARYETLEEAKAGHALVVESIKERTELSGEYQLQLTDRNRNDERSNP